MMFPRFGDGEDLDRRRRLFALLASFRLWTDSSMGLRHTISQVRYRVDELSSPPGHDEVLFTEAERERKRNQRQVPSENSYESLTLAVQYARQRQASVESSGTESRVPSWPGLVVGYRLATEACERTRSEWILPARRCVGGKRDRSDPIETIHG